MAMTTKCTFATLGSIILVVSFIITILGIVIMTSSVPESSCGPPESDIGISAADQDSIDSAINLICRPLIIGGILALVGGGLSVGCGMQEDKCGIIAASVLFNTAAVFLIVGSLALMVFSAVFGNMCNDFECDAAQMDEGCKTFSSGLCAGADVCCSGSDSGGFLSLCSAQCKADNDWACDIAAKKVSATAFGIIGLVVTLVAGCCGCAATCCCPDQWNWKGAPKAEGAALAQPAVIGQPVSLGGTCSNTE